MTEETFLSIETEYGCGYWWVCDDHACKCAPSAKVSKGWNADVYNSMREAQLEKAMQEEIFMDYICEDTDNNEDEEDDSDEYDNEGEEEFDYYDYYNEDPDE